MRAEVFPVAGCAQLPGLHVQRLYYLVNRDVTERAALGGGDRKESLCTATRSDERCSTSDACEDNWRRHGPIDGNPHRGLHERAWDATRPATHLGLGHDSLPAKPNDPLEGAEASGSVDDLLKSASTHSRASCHGSAACSKGSHVTGSRSHVNATFRWERLTTPIGMQAFGWCERVQPLASPEMRAMTGLLERNNAV